MDAPRIQGKWDDAMYAEMADGTQQQLWKISPMPANPTRSASQAPCPWARFYVLREYWSPDMLLA